MNISFKMHVALSVWPGKNCFKLVLLHQIEDGTPQVSIFFAYLVSLFVHKNGLTSNMIPKRIDCHKMLLCHFNHSLAA